jgi:DNA polymerase-3 subunit gamma/tau
MSYLALYRKLRPKTFDDMIGQRHIIRILKNQLSRNQVSHAYLFCGTRGTGKTSTAKILAKAINCKNPTEAGPCNECESCVAIDAGRNLNVVEIDAASNNGVDNIREIREEVKYPPTDGGTKVYIIDEVHMLSSGAFNALLKTLEEPPEKVIFILATTDPQKIPATILSRCQRLDFKRISPEDMFEAIKAYTLGAEVDIEDNAIAYIVSVSDGAMRDALSLLDQCLAYYSGENIDIDKVMNITGAVDKSIFFNLFDALNDFDSLKCVDIINEAVVNGKDIGQFISDFIQHLRNLLIVKAAGSGPDLSEETVNCYIKQAEGLNPQTIIGYIKEFSALSGSLRYSVNERVLLETTCIKLCFPEEIKDSDNITQRLLKLEKRMEKGFEGVERPASQNPAEVKERANLIRPKAVPEDIKDLTGRWNEFTSGIEGPLGAYFRSTFPGYMEDGFLYIVTESASMSQVLKKKEEEIKALLYDSFGKDFNLFFIAQEEYNSKHISNYGGVDETAGAFLKGLDDKLNGFYDIQ